MAILEAPVVEMTPVGASRRGAALIGPLALLIALVLVIGMAGLGIVKNDSGGDPGAAGSRLAKAADTTTKAGSSKGTVAVKTNVVEGKRATPVQVTGVGAFDYAAGNGQLDEPLSGETV